MIEYMLLSLDVNRLVLIRRNNTNYDCCRLYFTKSDAIIKYVAVAPVLNGY